MDDRVRSILQGIPANALAKVAGGALGLAGPSQLTGAPTLSAIGTPHADARTIGIVHVSGMAVVDDAGPARPWSSVAKVVDRAVEGRFNAATSPENEELVYAQGHFAGMGLGFRPARCFHISHPGEKLTVLWLEDLTGARSAPFTVDELARMVRHLGTWNAVVAANPPRLPFSVGLDFQIRRWEYWDFPTRAEALKGLTDDPIVQAMYASRSVEVAAEFASVFGQLVARSRALPHALSFSDGPIGNFFHRPDETIAVDWSGLSSDPLGADGGCFIGSALTWGRQFAEVARHERALFADFAAGIADGGCREDPRVLRSAYLAHMAFYLGTIAILPTMVTGPHTILPREFLEKRFGGPLDEVAIKARQVIDLLPAYIAEVRDLLA